MLCHHRCYNALQHILLHNPTQMAVYFRTTHIHDRDKHLYANNCNIACYGLSLQAMSVFIRKSHGGTMCHREKAQLLAMIFRKNIFLLVHNSTSRRSMHCTSHQKLINGTTNWQNIKKNIKFFSCISTFTPGNTVPHMWVAQMLWKRMGDSQK